MSKNKQRGLGRVLTALIGDMPTEPNSASSEPVGKSDQNSTQARATQSKPSAAKSTKSRATDSQPEKIEGYRLLGVDLLRPGQFQPRQNFDDEDIDILSKSLKEKGVLQPLLVRAISGEPGQYEIIAGERRWRAAQKAGLHQVPVIIDEIEDRAALEIGIIENVQRTDLNPIEEAEAFQRLMDEFSYTQENLSKVIGKSRSHIANILRLTGLPTSIRAYVIDGSLSAGHARALLGVSNPLEIAKKIIAEGLSVRAVERLAKNAQEKNGKKGDIKGSDRSNRANPEKDADTLALEKTLSDAIGLAVHVHHVDTGGSVRVDYKSLEQLDEIVRRIMKS